MRIDHRITAKEVGQTLDLLRSVDIFKGLPDEQLGPIAEACLLLKYDANEVVCQAGDPGDALFVVAEGRVVVLADGGPGVEPTPVADLGAGECFGEMALLSNQPRSATVRTAEACWLLAIHRTDFSRIASEHSIHERVVGILMERLRKTGERLDAIHRSRSALTAYLQDMLSFEGEGLTGASGATKKLLAQIEAAAGTDLPVLIEGPMGSGKSLCAALVIRGGARAEEAIMALDCSEMGSASCAAIFGYEADAFVGAEVQRLGALEVCDGGTLIIGDPQALSGSDRDRVLDAVRTGRFCRLGGTQELDVRCRVIVGHLRSPGEAALLDDESVGSVFPGGYVVIPSLQDRRRDVPVIAASIAAKHARALGRTDPTITPAAMETLVSHDWPGNVGELSTVLRRAVALASDGVIDTDEIILHLPPGQRAGKFDLMSIPAVANLLKSKWYPLILQVPTAAVLGWICYMCFFGPQTEENPALILTWPIWWAALPISFLLLGRIWCSACPFPLVGNVVQKVACLNRKVPAFFRRTDIWPMTALFIFLTWADEYWHYPDFPRMTGIVLVSVLAGTVLLSLIYSRRAWCRYLCPLGGVNGVYSMASFVELRPNVDVCATTCTDHACISANTDKPCPMLERPMALDSNRNCNLCMNCAKVCQNDAVHVYLRQPGAELWEQRRPMLAAGVLSVLLSGTMLVHALGAFAENRGMGLIDVGPAAWLSAGSEEMAWTITFFSGLVGSLILALIASAFSARQEGRSVGENLAHYGLAMAVMALFLHISLEGSELIHEGVPKVIALVLGGSGGLSASETYGLTTPLFVVMFRVLTAAVGTLLTVMVIRRIAKARGGAAIGARAARPYVALAAIFGLLFIMGIAGLPSASEGEDEADAVASVSMDVDAGAQPEAQ